MSLDHLTTVAPDQRNGHPDPDDAVRAHWLDVANKIKAVTDATKAWMAAVERAEAAGLIPDRSAADEQSEAR